MKQSTVLGHGQRAHLYRDERWRGHEDDLQHPESDVRDGEGFIVADILTTRLLGVTGEVGLLVAPHLLGGSPQHQDPEDEEDSQPDLADDQEVPKVFTLIFDTTHKHNQGMAERSGSNRGVKISF
uniref:Uncharacterized protein n=1 Tax=Nothobranchius furzeri TaxID=105023 RepID=A0A8C6L8U9_NOTFU